MSDPLDRMDRVGRLIDGDLDRTGRIEAVSDLLDDAELQAAARQAVALERRLKAWDPARDAVPEPAGAPIELAAARTRRLGRMEVWRAAAAVLVVVVLSYAAGAARLVGGPVEAAEFTSWGAGFTQATDRTAWMQETSIPPGGEATIAVERELEGALHLRFRGTSEVRCEIVVASGGRRVRHQLSGAQVHYGSLHRGHEADTLTVRNLGGAPLVVGVGGAHGAAARVL